MKFLFEIVILIKIGVYIIKFVVVRNFLMLLINWDMIFCNCSLLFGNWEKDV